MNRSPSNLSEVDRKSVCAALNAALVDALEFYGQLKLAHWNVRGPHFMSYHQLFEEVAATVQGHSDDVAERISTLGAKVLAGSKYVAANTTLPEYEAATEKDMEHVWRLAAGSTRSWPRCAPPWPPATR